MSNHPNRSKKPDNPARNPEPEEVRTAREQAGLTQTEAGRLIYTPMRTWQDWEGGQRRMHPAFYELFNIKKHKAKKE